MTDWSTLKKLIWLRIIKGGGSALRTVTGALIHVTNALALPAKALSVNVEPIQDLHGYDSPWPAGGNINLLPNNQTDGTSTDNGITLKAENGVYTLSGLATANAKFLLPLSATVDLSPSTNKICFLNTAQFGSVTIGFTRDGTRIHYWGMTSQNRVAVGWSDTGNETIDGVEIVVPTGTNLSTPLVISPVLMLSTKTDVTVFSPYSNICPISGRTSATVTRTGKNLFDVSKSTEFNQNVTLTFNADGSMTCKNDNSYAVVPTVTVIILIPPGTYTVSSSSAVDGTIDLYTSDDGVTYSWYANGLSQTVLSKTVIINKPYIQLRWTVGGNTTSTLPPIQLELGSTPTPYEPYSSNTYTIQLGDTVYGGTLDVTGGKMVVDRALWTRNTATMNNNNNYPGWQNSGIGALIGSGYNLHFEHQTMNIGTEYSANTVDGYDILFLRLQTYGKTQDEWKALAIDVQIVAELATPIEITLTPTQIDMLLGENNLWSDAGDSTLTYYAEGEASTSEALGILLGGTYNNPGGADDVSDDEALGILLGGS